MKNILSFLDFLQEVFLAIILFVCPLIFFTDITQNPYQIQILLLSISLSFFVLCLGVKFLCNKEIILPISKIDLWFYIFIFIGVLSVLINYFTSQNIAIINEFLRKADYVFLSCLGFLLVKFLPIVKQEKQQTYKFLFNVFCWSLLWLFWGIFDSFFYGFILFCIAIYLCVRHLKTNKFAVLDVLLSVCFVASLYGICQNLGFEIFWKINVSSDFGPRAISTFGNPNFLASFVALFLPYNLFLLLNAKDKKQIILIFFVLSVLIAFLILSATRSTWLSLIIVFIFSLFIKDVRINLIQNKKIFLIFFLISILLFMFWPKNIKEDFKPLSVSRLEEVKQVRTWQDFTLNTKNLIPAYHQRLMMWTCVLKNFQQALFLGRGLNTFQLYYADCQGQLTIKNPSLDKIKTQANAVHNEFLEILSDSGILGFSTFLILIIIFFVSFYKNINNLENQEKLKYLFLSFGLMAVLFDNLLNITLRIVIVSFAFWFCFSFISLSFSKNKVIKLKASSSVLLFIILCFISSVLVFWQGKIFLAHKKELSAYKLFTKQKYELSANIMKQAINLSTYRAEPYYNLIQSLIKVGNLQEAKEITLQALKYYPNYFEFYFELSALQQAEGNKQDSLKNLQKTLLLYPSYSPAGLVYASLFAEQNITNQDKTLLLTLTEIQYYNPYLKTLLAEVYFKENTFDLAEMWAEKALKENIFDKQTINLYQNILIKQNKQNSFLEIVNKAQLLKQKLKNFQPSQDLLNELELFYQQNKTLPDIVLLLAEYYYKNKEPCKALEILENFYLQNKVLTKSLGLALSNSALSCGKNDMALKYLNILHEQDSYDEKVQNMLKNL